MGSKWTHDSCSQCEVLCQNMCSGFERGKALCFTSRVVTRVFLEGSMT